MGGDDLGYPSGTLQLWNSVFQNRNDEIEVVPSPEVVSSWILINLNCD